MGAVTSIIGSSLKNTRPSGMAQTSPVNFRLLQKIKKIVCKHPPRAEVVDAGSVDLELLQGTPRHPADLRKRSNCDSADKIG